MPLASQSPYPIIVYSVANYGPHLSHFWRPPICNFRDPILVTFYLCIYLILNEEHLTFGLQYKHSGTFANRKYEELSYPKNRKMCDPILVTLLIMWPDYSQPRPKNATPSSGTSPLASYKEVPFSPGLLACFSFCFIFLYSSFSQLYCSWHPLAAKKVSVAGAGCLQECKSTEFLWELRKTEVLRKQPLR